MTWAEARRAARELRRQLAAAGITGITVDPGPGWISICVRSDNSGGWARTPEGIAQLRRAAEVVGAEVHEFEGGVNAQLRLT